MERRTKGDSVNDKRGYSSAAETRVKSRAATPDTLSFRGSPKGNMEGTTLNRTPSSLVFAAADSESDSDHRPDHRPRRRCSIGTRGSASDIHDLRMLASEHGSGNGTRRSSYDLSVCSGGSLETMQTNDEIMRVFEVTLPASFKKAVTKEKADYSSSGNEGDDERSRGLLDTLASRRRFSMETIWSTRKKALSKSSSAATTQGDTPIIETSVATKSPRKVRARRFAKTAVVCVSLAMFVVLPWLVITIYFGIEGNDPSSLISSITARVPGMLEGLFDSSGEEEVHHELVGNEPLPVPAGVNRRQEEDRLLRRRERVARERQARVQANRRRKAREQRERRMRSAEAKESSTRRGK